MAEFIPGRHKPCHSLSQANLVIPERGTHG